VFEQLDRIETVTVGTHSAVLDVHAELQRLGGLNLAKVEEVHALLVQVQEQLSAPKDPRAAVPPVPNPGARTAEEPLPPPQKPYAPRGDAPTPVPRPKRPYTLHGLLAVGDVADLHLARARSDFGDAAESAYLLKVSRVPGGHRVLDNERHALTHLLTRAGDT